MKKPAHILVIRFSAMGDVAMSVPVLERLVKTYPELKITVLTKPSFAPLFEKIARVKVFSADVKNTYNGFFGLWKLACELKKLKFDFVADLHNVLRTKILRFFFFLFGISCASVDKGRKEKKALTRFGSKQIFPLKTTHERYAAVFEKLGFPVDLSIEIKKNQLQLNGNVLELTGKDPLKWIGIAPFAAHTSKMYPLDLMETVISELNRTAKYKIILFGGGKQEEEICANLESKYDHVVSAVGKLTFQEELNLIANLDAMLSMDSGNGHLAAIFKVPVISLWGATHPYAGFAPFHQKMENQILPDLKQFPYLPTSIYGNKFYPEYEDAMRSIKPQTIVEKVQNILND
ncbi:MAG TPA: glycosyltransferase family 9 protein [Flavobacteriaceae bacterium]|nr:glycosyltransferase family 9 protein [Flavobacteriaceae bacterium]